jgi:hypothetical protein
MGDSKRKAKMVARRSHGQGQEKKRLPIGAGSRGWQGRIRSAAVFRYVMW